MSYEAQKPLKEKIDKLLYIKLNLFMMKDT